MIRSGSFSRVMELVREPMLLVTGEGEVIGANATAERLVGEGPLRGRLLSTLIADDPARAAEYLHGCLSGGAPMAGWLTLRCAGRAQRFSASAMVLDAGAQPTIAVRLDVDAAAPPPFLTTELQAATTAFSGALTPDDVATLAVARGCTALRADRGGVTLLGGEAAPVEFLGLLGHPREQLDAYVQAPSSVQRPILDATRERRSLFLESRAAVAAAYPDFRFPHDGEGYAFAVAPLLVEGRSLGSIAFGFDRARPFGPDERAFVQELAAQAALALDRARLYEASALARASAEALLRARDDFLSSVSHELRTPLTAILGWASLLRARANDPSAVAHAVTVIERNARAQAQVVEDLLDVGRMVSGKLRVDRRAVDPAAVARAAVEAARPAAEGAGVVLAARIPGALGAVLADPDRLQQVLGILLSNAIKFTPRGGRAVVEAAAAEGVIRLRVSDDGDGIDAALLPFVFDRFRQAERGNGRDHGGLGLGLSIARHLVELHDGTIVAESPGPGRGAAFTVTLPARPGAESGGGEPWTGDRATPVAGRLLGLRVIVLDDHADTRDLLVAMLRQHGVHAIPLARTGEVLDVVARETPDLLVSDIGMPDEDGYALLRRVRRISRIPALALTAFAGAHDERLAALAGFDGYLAKPVTPARLLEAVARVADRRRHDAAGA